MKKSDILEMFIKGKIIYKNVRKVTVDEYTDMKWAVGAVDGNVVRHGTYLAYYMQIEDSHGVPVTPDYTLHDEEGMEIFLLRIDDMAIGFYLYNNIANCLTHLSNETEHWRKQKIIRHILHSLRENCITED